jgi:uncharacterized membrane protein YjgN (DUF898 family)
MSDVATAPAVSPARAHVVEFRGQGGEYFRIWIVNLLLKIITIGIYSAWAKVRTKRYFYGSTLLDSTAFEYHATPWQILKGRLIAVAAIVIYSLASTFVPLLGVALAIAYLFVAPWVINMSLRFNARMSSYRNVRFDFVGSYGRAFVVLILLPIAAVLTIGILWPLAHRQTVRYLASGYRFGDRPFTANPTIGRFYVIYLQALGLFIAFFVLLAVLIAGAGFLFSGVQLGAVRDLEDLARHPALVVLAILPALISLAFYLFLFAFVRAKARNLVFATLLLNERHRFASGLSPWGLTWIIGSNLIATVLTLGLFTPWAQIRVARYYAERTAVYPASDLSEFVSSLPAGTQAFGSELADLAGLEVGI